MRVRVRAPGDEEGCAEVCGRDAIGGAKRGKGRGGDLYAYGELCYMSSGAATRGGRGGVYMAFSVLYDFGWENGRKNPGVGYILHGQGMI